MKNFFMKAWPVIFIFSVWFIFISPYFLKNKTPFPSTYQVNNFAPWSAYEKFWGPVKNGAMPDIITQIYPWKKLTIDVWKIGQVPLWNPYSFSGTPLLANYQSAVFSPFNILFLILPFVNAWSILVLLQPLLAGIFMYLFVRTLKVSKVAGLLSAISFMFSGFITVWLGYATLAYAFLFLPIAFFAIEEYYKTKKPKFLALLSVTIPLSFFSGHFQISLYFLVSILAYILYKFIFTRNIHNTLYIILYTVFGLLLSAAQLVPSIEFYSQSLRSTIFQKGEVIPWYYLPTLLSPDFFGNPVTRNDWFGHYAEWSGYIGVVPLILAFYGFFSKKRPQTLFLFFFGFLALLFAFDSPLSSLLIALKLPVLSTSAVSRVIILYIFAFAVLSGFGFDDLVRDIKNKKRRKILITLAIFGVVFLFLWTMVLLKLFIPLDKIIIARQNLILPTLIFVASSFIILISFFQKNRILLPVVFLLLAIVTFDMLRFTKKWQPFDSKNLIFPNTETSNSFAKISGYNRVMANFGQEASVYYRLPSVEGYDALYISRYGQFITALSDGKVKDAARSVVLLDKNGLYATKAINLLDVKYIVHKLADDHAGWTFPFWTYPEGQFKLIYKDAKYEFYENTVSFPHVFLTGKYRVVSDSQKIINAMFDKDFDLRGELVLEENPGFTSYNKDIGKATIVKHSPNKIDIEVETSQEGLLFLSDSFYPGWKAYVDGKTSPILRADYAFRSIVVPEGKHSVEFTYFPSSFKLGLYLGATGLIGILILGIVLGKRST